MTFTEQQKFVEEYYASKGLKVSVPFRRYAFCARALKTYDKDEIEFRTWSDEKYETICFHKLDRFFKSTFFDEHLSLDEWSDFWEIANGEKPKLSLVLSAADLKHCSTMKDIYDNLNKQEDKKQWEKICYDWIRVWWESKRGNNF